MDVEERIQQMKIFPKLKWFKFSCSKLQFFWNIATLMWLHIICGFFWTKQQNGAVEQQRPHTLWKLSIFTMWPFTQYVTQPWSTDATRLLRNSWNFEQSKGKDCSMNPLCLLEISPQVGLNPSIWTLWENSFNPTWVLRLKSTPKSLPCPQRLQGSYEPPKGSDDDGFGDFSSALSPHSKFPGVRNKTRRHSRSER